MVNHNIWYAVKHLKFHFSTYFSRHLIEYVNSSVGSGIQLEAECTYHGNRRCWTPGAHAPQPATSPPEPVHVHKARPPRRTALLYRAPFRCHIVNYRSAARRRSLSSHNLSYNRPPPQVRTPMQCVPTRSGRRAAPQVRCAAPQVLTCVRYAASQVPNSNGKRYEACIPGAGG